jgi:hypothetical protein
MGVIMSKSETMVYREGHGVITKREAELIDKARQPDNRSTVEYRPVERGSWVYRNGELVPKHSAAAHDMVEKLEKRSALSAPMVMGDIKEYRNVIDGKPITSRSEHREFLKRNGVEEVGNEVSKPVDKAAIRRSDLRKDLLETKQQLEQNYDFGAELAAESPQHHPDLDPIDVTPADDGKYIRSEVSVEN